MNTLQKQNKEGFTIIEVVLVLAIAGLIFLMVFIALPALQRSQRDTQRRDDASRFISQLNSYGTNNNGKVPSSSAALDGFKDNYLKWDASADTSEYNDPKTGDPYNIRYAANLSEFNGTVNDGAMIYRDGVTCDGESGVAASGNRVAAVRVKLEGSGIFCQDNQ